MRRTDAKQHHDLHIVQLARRYGQHLVRVRVRVSVSVSVRVRGFGFGFGLGLG